MYFSDGCKVLRKRSKKENTISFTDAEGKTTEWERIGTGLPEEYLRLIGNTDIKLPDGSSINPCISVQLDPHFFLSLSDAFKAKVLGSISGLDMIDGALGLTSTEARENQTRIKNLNVRIEESKTLKDSHEKQLIETEKLYEKFAKVSKELTNNYNNLNKIGVLKFKIEESRESLEILTFKRNKDLKFLESLKSNIDSLDKVKLLQKVSQLFQDISRCQQTIESIGPHSKMLSSSISVLNNALEKIESASGKTELLIKLNNLKSKIKLIDLKIFSEQKNIWEIKLEDLKKESKEIFKDIDECPLCGSIIGKKE